MEVDDKKVVGNMVDSTRKVNDKKEVENGMMKMKMGTWDLYVKLEDWPMTDGMSREGIYKEFGKGFMWALKEIWHGWSAERKQKCDIIAMTLQGIFEEAKIAPSWRPKQPRDPTRLRLLRGESQRAQQRPARAAVRVEHEIRARRENAVRGEGDLVGIRRRIGQPHAGKIHAARAVVE